MEVHRRSLSPGLPDHHPSRPTRRSGDSGREYPPVGLVTKGKVVSIKDRLGCFVSVEGFPRDGLVHVSQLADFHVDYINSVVSEGQEVWVVVTSSSQEEAKIGLSMRDVDQKSGELLHQPNERPDRTRRGDTWPEVQSIERGRVMSIIEGLGCFVAVPGWARDGLVHISQLVDHHVDRVGDYVSIGDDVYVQVVSVDMLGGKINLSIQNVNQETGELDAQHGGPAMKITGANTGKLGGDDPLDFYKYAQCTKCGCSGHMAAECFGGGFGMVKETAEEKEMMTQLKQKLEESEKKKEQKRHKKHQHRHHHKHQHKKRRKSK